MAHTKYCYFICGDSFFMKTAIQEMEDTIRPALDELHWEESSGEFKKIKSLTTRRGPLGDAFTTIALSFGLFIFTKISEKIFNTIYEETIKSPLERTIKKVLRSLRRNNNKQIVYQSLFYLSDADVSIAIGLIVNNDSDAEMSLVNIKKVYISACKWISSNGKKAEIHCYTIKDGNFSPIPSFFNSIEEVKYRQQKCS